MTDPAEIWQPEPRKVPPELVHGYPHADYIAEPSIAERMSGIPLMDRLDEVMRTRLHELFGNP